MSRPSPRTTLVTIANFVAIALLFTTIWFLSTAHTAGSTVMQPDSQFEAENGALSAPMVTLADPTASNGTYVARPTRDGAGYADYEIQIPQDGTYQLKGKVKTADGASNSFTVRFDSAAATNWHLPWPIAVWTWESGPTVSLKAGPHRLRIGGREPNTKLDKIELRTRSLTGTPHGSTTPVTSATASRTPTRTPTSAVRSPTPTRTPTSTVRSSTPTRTPTPTVTATEVVPTVVPVTTIDLTTWKLTLPTGPAGHPDEISSAQLLAGYTSPYFTPSASGISFWSPVTGTTTSGSSYPRSELREEQGPNHDQSSGWDYTTLTSHTLSATVAVTQVPSTGKVIIGQIHGLNNGQPLVKLIWDTANGGELRANYRVNAADSGTSSTNIKTGVPLGSSFSYVIKLTNAGILTVQFNDETPIDPLGAGVPIGRGWNTALLYFKAGVYVQDNAGPSTEGGCVTFTAIEVVHS